VDRVPPADLIEQLLPATAYAYEIRGARRVQAWENLKKMRGLVRRIQNRGYATLTRIADHLDSLTAGDESNAVIEALDAVNLMTIHASKGLEFPVVFVVNLAKGAAGPPQPIRVIADGDDGEPSVSVGPFVSATDEAEREREKHETRRLLYVALTRARDRLYLASVLKKGMMQPGRGSLGEVLPDSVRQLFSLAATSFDEFALIGWAGPSGRPFNWRICRVPAALSPESAPVQDTPEAPVPDASGDRLGPLAHHSGTRRTPVTRWLTDSGTTEDPQFGAPGDSLVGTLVHRLFQFMDEPPAAANDERALERARELLGHEERATLVDADATLLTAVEVWRRMRERPEVTTLLTSGRRLYEVPFSMRLPPAPGAEKDPTPGPAIVVLRGTIDCLVVRPDGSVVVVEFKTGRPRKSHDRQLETYLDAARALFPAAEVSGQLIYA
jgi:ATP-dependent exoDNAse (exonuclease V) beta subunit